MRLVLLRIIKLLIFAVTVPVVVLLARCTHDGEAQAERGRKWCEGVIAIFESDRASFLTRHAKRIHHGLLVLRPTSESGPVSADFTVKRSGEFTCRYWEAGLFFAPGHRYTSERRRWVEVGQGQL